MSEVGGEINSEIDTQPEPELAQPKVELKSVDKIKNPLEELSGLTYAMLLSYQKARKNGEPKLESFISGSDTKPDQMTEKDILATLGRVGKADHYFSGQKATTEINPLSWEMTILADYALAVSGQKVEAIHPAAIIKASETVLNEAERRRLTEERRGKISKAFSWFTAQGDLNYARSEAKDCKILYSYR